MTILIVEDEFLIRINTADVLQDAGFKVLEARDADEAIAVLENDASIDIVITDINMPGSTDGVKLMLAVRDRWPPIKVILTSGRARPREVPDEVLFMPKPVQARDLTDAVARLSS